MAHLHTVDEYARGELGVGGYAIVTHLGREVYLSLTLLAPLNQSALEVGLGVGDIVNIEATTKYIVNQNTVHTVVALVEVERTEERFEGVTVDMFLHKTAARVRHHKPIDTQVEGDGIYRGATHNFGAQLVDRVDKVLKMTVLCASCVMVVMWLSCEIFADNIVSIFVNQDESNARALMEAASHGLRIVVIMMPIVGFQMVVANFFQSIGRAPVSLFMSSTRQLLYLIPLVWLLPQKFGLDGVWMAMPVSDTLSAITAAIVLKLQYKKSLMLPSKEQKVVDVEKNTDDNHVVISIGRQFGAGGRYIGKLIANHYGIKYYDSELLVEAAKDMGFAPEIFEKADEVPSLQTSFGNLADLSSPNTSEPMLSGANLFKAQSETMQRIAETESCVIVGRASDYVLRERKDVVTFFLRAPMEFRAENIASRHNIDIKKAQKLVEERETARKEYYDYYTGKEWGDSKGYDLCVDVSKLGFEKTAEMMIAFIDSVFSKKAEK